MTNQAINNKSLDREQICYHHYSLTFDSKEIPQHFQDVKFILVAGCPQRAESQGSFLAENLFNGINFKQQYKLEQLTKTRSRFTLFKVGPVLLSNHGMGSASMSIALHELFLMCREAAVLDSISVIRFGTCGGLGVAAGTVCITNRALDPLFQDFVELKICMQLVRRPCKIDLETANLLERLLKSEPNNEQLGEYEVRLGATVATNDFYEEQGRTNGAICDHTIEDKMRFLRKAQEMGVINMEMECNHLAAMCHKLNVSFGVICVALTNRIVDDRVKLTHEQVSLFERRLFWLNLLFIKHKLSVSGN